MAFSESYHLDQCLIFLHTLTHTLTHTLLHTLLHSLCTVDGVALEGPLICDETIIQQAQNFSMNHIVPNTSLGFDIEKVPTSP